MNEDFGTLGIIAAAGITRFRRGSSRPDFARAWIGRFQDCVLIAVHWASTATERGAENAGVIGVNCPHQESLVQ